MRHTHHDEERMWHFSFVERTFERAHQEGDVLRNSNLAKNFDMCVVQELMINNNDKYCEKVGVSFQLILIIL